MRHKRPYFILSVARSGSTSLARILETATNGCCVVEPSPNLNVETRLAMDGKLTDRTAVVRDVILPRVMSGLEDGGVYGEKNVTYGPFVGELHEILDCRFIYLRRDGRDVVRSLMDWHDTMFGTIYRECREAGNLTPRALATAAALPVHLDTSDYSRPRPRPSDPLSLRWESLARFEMCAWYWAKINDLYLDQLSRLPEGSWVDLDYTRADAEAVVRAAAFVGLSGIDRTRVDRMLSDKINSTADRAGQERVFGDWQHWDGGLRRRFKALAGATMRRLGYFADDATSWRPEGFGRCWYERQADLEWFEWMYDGRRRMHEDALAWIRARQATGEQVESVADFGCGLGVGYCDELGDLRYVGFDLIPANTEWCRQHRVNPRHEYHCLDFVREPTPGRYDLVLSSGTIDNSWDVEAYLDAMIRASRHCIYLTFYRGWFPELDEHRYSWSDLHACFYNDISPRRVLEHLERRGCTGIVVEPRPTGRRDIPFETRVIARVP